MENKLLFLCGTESPVQISWIVCVVVYEKLRADFTDNTQWSDEYEVENQVGFQVDLVGGVLSEVIS